MVDLAHLSPRRAIKHDPLTGLPGHHADARAQWIADEAAKAAPVIHADAALETLAAGDGEPDDARFRRRYLPLDAGPDEPGLTAWPSWVMGALSASGLLVIAAMAWGAWG